MIITNYTSYDIHKIIDFISGKLNIRDEVNLTIVINENLLDKFDNIQLDAILYKSPLLDNYSLILRKNLDNINLIVSHEMVHLQQYEEGKLDINFNTKQFYWKGKEFPTVEYNQRPWEREAIKLSAKLLSLYKKV